VLACARAALAYLFEAMGSMFGKACTPDSKPEPPPPPPKAAPVVPQALDVGTRVTLIDLHAKETLNGSVGVVESVDAATLRHTVKLEGTGKSYALKRANLRPLKTVSALDGPGSGSSLPDNDRWEDAVVAAKAWSAAREAHDIGALLALTHKSMATVKPVGSSGASVGKATSDEVSRAHTETQSEWAGRGGLPTCVRVCLPLLKCAHAAFIAPALGILWSGWLCQHH